MLDRRLKYLVANLEYIKIICFEHYISERLHASNK